MNPFGMRELGMEEDRTSDVVNVNNSSTHTTALRNECNMAISVIWGQLPTPLTDAYDPSFDTFHEPAV